MNDVKQFKHSFSGGVLGEHLKKKTETWWRLVCVFVCGRERKRVIVPQKWSSKSAESSPMPSLKIPNEMICITVEEIRQGLKLSRET